MASVFYKLGSDLLGTTTLSYKSKLLNFRRHFGVSPHTCDVVHKKIKKQHKNDVSKLHLLWSLCFLCESPKAKTTRKTFGVDVKTFRKHTTYIIICIKNLKIVSKINYGHFFIIASCSQDITDKI